MWSQPRPVNVASSAQINCSNMAINGPHGNLLRLALEFHEIYHSPLQFAKSRPRTVRRQMWEIARIFQLRPDGFFLASTKNL